MLKIVNSSIGNCFVKAPHHINTIQLHACLLVNEFLGALSRKHMPWRQDIYIYTLKFCDSTHVMRLLSVPPSPHTYLQCPLRPYYMEASIYACYIYTVSCMFTSQCVHFGNSVHPMYQSSAYFSWKLYCSSHPL